MGAGQQAQHESGLVQRLEAYARGDYEDAVAGLGSVTPFAQLRSAMQREGRQWIRAAGDQEERRRTQIAALFALEAGRAALSESRWWSDVRSVIEWGCVQLAAFPQSDFERKWHLSSIGLLQGAGDYRFLIGSDDIRNDRYAPVKHLEHAIRRFPNDARLRLAELMTRAEGRLIANRPGVIVGYLARGRTSEEQARRHVRQTLADLASLEQSPTIRAEVALRRGILLFDLGEFRSSLSDLAIAAQSSDPFVGYLAQLISGFAHEAAGSPNDALTAFERARATLPTAASGVMTLSARLFLKDDRRMAVAQLLRAWPTGQSGDPWREYRFGDYRLLAGQLATLRKDVQ